MTAIEAGALPSSYEPEGGGRGIGQRSVSTPRRHALGSLQDGTIRGLDGLRAISVILVIFAHYGFDKVIPGGLGVTNFFFISGFLITTLMLRERQRHGRIAIRSFYIRRLLRLQPELVAFVLISGLGFSGIIGLPRIGDVVGAFLYVSNYVQLIAPVAGWSTDIRWPQLWSLSVEEHFYLTYPLLFSLLSVRPRRLSGVLAAVCMVTLLYRLVLIENGVGSQYIYLATEARLDSIAYGCLMSMVLWHWGGALGAVLERWGWLALCLCAAGFALVLLERDPFFRDSFRYSLQGLSLCVLFACLYAWSPGRLMTTLLDHPVLRWLGVMSYGAYLWHMEPVMLLRSLTDVDIDTPQVGYGRMFLLAVALSVATFALAYLSHLIVFRPFLGLRRRFGSHVRSTQGVIETP